MIVSGGVVGVPLGVAHPLTEGQCRFVMRIQKTFETFFFYYELLWNRGCSLSLSSSFLSFFSSIVNGHKCKVTGRVRENGNLSGDGYVQRELLSS